MSMQYIFNVFKMCDIVIVCSLPAIMQYNTNQDKAIILYINTDICTNVYLGYESLSSTFAPAC